MRVRAGSCLLALSAVLVLTGCSSEEPPSSLPRLPSVASSSTTLTPATVPQAATAATPAGASAFARYFLDTVSEAYERANLADLAKLSKSTCRGCDALVEGVEQLAEDGLRREGGAYTVTAAVTPAIDGQAAVVTVNYTRTAARLVDASGRTVRSAGPVPDTQALMSLVRERERWLVDGYQVLAA